MNEQISTQSRPAGEAREGRIVCYAPGEQRARPEWIGGEIAQLFLRDD